MNCPRCGIDAFKRGDYFCGNCRNKLVAAHIEPSAGELQLFPGREAIVTLGNVDSDKDIVVHPLNAILSVRGEAAQGITLAEDGQPVSQPANLVIEPRMSHRVTVALREGAELSRETTGHIVVETDDPDVSRQEIMVTVIPTLLSADLEGHIAPQRSARSPSAHTRRALYARTRREMFSNRRSSDLSLRYSAAPAW